MVFVACRRRGVASSGCGHIQVVQSARGCNVAARHERRQFSETYEHYQTWSTGRLVGGEEAMAN